MRTLLLLCAALACFSASIILSTSGAHAVFWRGLTAPTNIDYHGWVIVRELPPSPCQWIRVSGGYYVRQCVY
ncbi:hypothetical protein SAMN05216338_107425 [Bradyrhizobium sp. Rc2d]|nr:hypothetical protein SAMN05216338_107425 [Bradyrhizobium sp. Rc2d]